MSDDGLHPDPMIRQAVRTYGFSFPVGSRT